MGNRVLCYDEDGVRVVDAKTSVVSRQTLLCHSFIL